MIKSKKLPEIEIDTLGYVLDRTLNALIKQLNRLFQERNIDLQHAQFTVLKMLWCVDGLSQSQLAQLLNKNPAAVCRSLKYLESKGYIERRQKNGSTYNVFLTEYANGRRNEIEAVADCVTEAAFAKFSKCQRETIINLLNSIYKNSK